MREGIPIPVSTPTVYGVVEGLPLQMRRYRRRADGYITEYLHGDPTQHWLPNPDWEEIPQPIYIVSLIVLTRVSRNDVFAPGTGPQDGAIRFPAGHPQAGQVEAVTRLIAAVG